ncbi:hypothetical protein [Streptomyces flaveolus]|uniref:hypothetical protein n=1 Tax=Streptomyces flaveolus TaxID=67297 RepID=UPI0004BF460D|nr:hypothetical protein [Streptomyces flaveolus]GGQ83638.1 hypothetical protein GCM10010216_51860 [Streptomyces flaveolus]
MTAGRYRVTVTVDGRPMIQGWWGSEVIARSKFTRWVGEHGDRPGARVTLTDEGTGTVLTEWPDPG